MTDVLSAHLPKTEINWSNKLEIRLTEKAIRDGVLRVWLQRIPEAGGVLHAFAVEKPHIHQPVGMATLYGRGKGSSAQERVMLLFRLQNNSADDPLRVGDLIDIRFEDAGDDALQQLELDIIAVE